MKKTIFKDYELYQITLYDKTYTDVLDENNTKYDISEINMEHLTFDLSVLSFHAFEIIYINRRDEKCYVYSFVYNSVDSVICINFISLFRRLPVDIVKNLEAAYYKNEIELEPFFPDRKRFRGFNVDKNYPNYVNLSELVGTFLVDKEGHHYEWNETKSFPEGIYGKKVYEVYDSEYNLIKEESDIMLFCQVFNDEILFFLDGDGISWTILTKDMMIDKFGDIWDKSANAAYVIKLKSEYLKWKSDTIQDIKKENPKWNENTVISYFHQYEEQLKKDGLLEICFDDES